MASLVAVKGSFLGKTSVHSYWKEPLHLGIDEFPFQGYFV